MNSPDPLSDKITEYLASGGLFNPEHMEHDKVRDLVTALDDQLAKLRDRCSVLERERDALRVEYESRAIWIEKMVKILGCENTDGFHCVDVHEFATQLVRERDALKNDWEAACADAKRHKEAAGKSDASCAAMREALEMLVNRRVICDDGQPAMHAWIGGGNIRDLILKALDSDCGKDLVRREELNDALGELASSTDLANTWARELGVEEARSEKQLKLLIDRIWTKVSARIARSVDREDVKPLVALLELLDRLGGLGLDKHEWIRDALAHAKERGLA